MDELSSVDFADLAEPAQLRLLAWFNIAQTRMNAGDRIGARAAFNEAIEAGAPIYAPAIALAALSRENDAEERKRIVSSAVSLIDKTRLRFADSKLERLDGGADLEPYSYELFLRLLGTACQLELSPAAFRLVDHGISMGSLQGPGRSEILFALAQRLRKENPKSSVSILLEEARRVLGYQPDASSELVREIISSLLVEKTTKGLATREYVDDFRSCISRAPVSTQLSETDYHAFVFAVLALRHQNDFTAGIDLCHDIMSRSDNGGDAAYRNSFIATFFDAQMKFMAGSKSEARASALLCKEQIEGFGSDATSVLGAAGLSEIKNGVDWILAESSVTAPFRNPKPKVGRNEPCPCGSGKKYKKCHGQP